MQQLVYVCDTCAGHARERGGDASLMHGLCVQCAAHCHEFIGHSVRNIGQSAPPCRAQGEERHLDTSTACPPPCHSMSLPMLAAL